MMKLKNNEERKEWLKNYRDWGVWYEDEHIGVKYYRYIFENGTQLIVDEYFTPKNDPVPAFTFGYYHLVGGPKPQTNDNGGWKYPWHPVYTRSPDSETGLVDFLKALGKDVDL